MKNWNYFPEIGRIFIFIKYQLSYIAKVLIASWLADTYIFCCSCFIGFIVCITFIILSQKLHFLPCFLQFCFSVVISLIAPSVSPLLFPVVLPSVLLMFVCVQLHFHHFALTSSKDFDGPLIILSLRFFPLLLWVFPFLLSLAVQLYFNHLFLYFLPISQSKQKWTFGLLFPNMY